MPTPRPDEIHNWTHKTIAMSRADAFVVSIPKSGRTWLRFCLQHYLCSRAGYPVSLSLTRVQSREVPDIRFSHDLWYHLTTPRRHQQILGTHLIPRGSAARRKSCWPCAIRGT